MFNYDKDGKLVKVFGGGGNEMGQLRRRTASGWTPATRRSRCSWCATAPTPGSSGSTSTATRIDATEARQGRAVPGAREDPRRRAAGARPARPRQPVRQGQQGDRPPRRRRGAGGRRCSTGSRSRGAAEGVAGRASSSTRTTPAFDKDGNIFVVEWVATGRVTFLKKVA